MLVKTSLLSNITIRNCLFLTLLLISITISMQPLFALSAQTANQAKAQYRSVDWVGQNISSNSSIITNSFNDFLISRYKPKSQIINLHNLTKEDVIDITQDVSKVYYTLISRQERDNAKYNTDNPLNLLLESGVLIRSWGNDKHEEDNSDPSFASMYLYKSDNVLTHTISTTWNYYKKNFITSQGQVIDLDTGITTSEGQSYALLRSIWMDEKETFDRVLNWTQTNMTISPSNSLFSWKMEKKDGKYIVTDVNSAADADNDIALALILASRKWYAEDYLDYARKIVDDIWKYTVVEIQGSFYQSLGSIGERSLNEPLIVNPSYLSPAHYKIFEQINKNSWNKLVSDTYNLLSQLQTKRSNEISLPPNWVTIRTDGIIGQASNYVPNSNRDDYGFDAFRVFFRVYLDAIWNNTKEAKDYLYYHDAILNRLRDRDGDLRSIYSTSGIALSQYSSISTNTALIFSSQNPKNAYIDIILSSVDKNKQYWGSETNYYDQNWAWFALLAATEGLVKY